MAGKKICLKTLKAITTSTTCYHHQFPNNSSQAIYNPNGLLLKWFRTINNTNANKIWVPSKTLAQTPQRPQRLHNLNLSLVLICGKA